MKKFKFFAMMALMLTVFSACQNDELAVEQPQAVAMVEEIPDVYLENGYLAFKSLDVVDSVVNVFATMTREERDAWDTQLGFQSARADFEKLFDEYEQLATMEEFLTFKQKSQGRLTFNDADPEDNSIDYPFVSTPLTPLLNSEGVIKIGKSLFQYTKSGRNGVYDGDLNKLKNIAQFCGDDMVEIQMQTKSTETNVINDFAKCHPRYPAVENRWWEFGSKRLINEFMVEKWRIWYHDNVWQRRNTYFLRQRGQKKGTFGWNDYRTVYTFSDMYFKYGTLNTAYGPGDTSNELQTAYVTLYADPITEITYPTNQTPPYLSLETVSLKCYVGFRGTSEGPFPIIHKEHSTFPGSSLISVNFHYN